MSELSRTTRAAEVIEASGVTVWRTSRYGFNTGTTLWVSTGPLVGVPDDDTGPLRVQGKPPEAAAAILECLVAQGFDAEAD